MNIPQETQKTLIFVERSGKTGVSVIKQKVGVTVTPAFSGGEKVLYLQSWKMLHVEKLLVTTSFSCVVVLSP